MTAEELRLALMSWARRHGILSEVVPFEEHGDLALVPFEPEAAEYFRTRKIVRVEAEGRRLSLFSRLPIAKAKKSAMVRSFARRYGEEGYSLVVDESKPFRIDQAVETYGPFQPLRLHNDAICCGSSIGLGNQRNAGTLTALASDGGGTMYGISCNHVIGGCSIALPGIPVVSPGIQDVSVEDNQIHVIGDYSQPAQMAQGLPSVTNIDRNRDVACFEIRQGAKLTSLQGQGEDAYDTPTSFASVEVDMPVKKWGRSTGFTQGEVSHIIDRGKRPEALEYSVTCFYGPLNSQTFKGTVYFTDVYEVTPVGPPFSLGGDSGALVVTDEPGREEVVGLVIAGSKRKSMVLPLGPALEELGLQLVSNYGVES
ncbi:MAG: hypothetical protein AAFX50_14105 [Acidobacteriota bacterium]